MSFNKRINCSNIQSRNIKSSSSQLSTPKITYKIKKKSTVVCSSVSSTLLVLQHLHRYLNQYHRSVRIFLLRHSISHQNQWENYQLHFLEHSYQNIRNFISLFMIWFACFVKSLENLIYVNIKRVLLFRRALTLDHLSHINFALSSTFCLQPIRRHRLVRIWKARIRRVFSNTCFRNIVY